MTSALRGFTSFRDHIRREFVQESAIDPSLFETAISFHRDVETGPGGDPSTPIHDALGWQYTRFGHQAKATLEAAIFRQETGEAWQAKLSSPVWDPKKGAHRKYETPKNNGSRAFLPPVNRQIRRAIAQRYRVEVPPPGESFWTWLEQHREIPIILTEGGKKALCLLSLGFVAIALYGVNGGYRAKDRIGNPIEPVLIDDLLPFCNPRREFVLAFDQDEKAETRAKVNRALSRFGRLLAQQGCTVSVALWNGRDGKGIDDLVVNCGPAAWERAYSEAMSLEHWRLWRRLENQLTCRPSIRLNTPDLSSLEIESLPTEGVLAIYSAKGSGKTRFIGGLVGDSQKALLAGHRICLMQNLCERLGMHYRGDLDKCRGQFIAGDGYTLKVGTCFDSLLSIDPNKFTGCDLILDEAVQGLRHLLTSSTCQKDGKRPALLNWFHRLVKAARRVILADADLNNAVIEYILTLREEGDRLFLIRNDHQRQGYPIRFLEAPDKSKITSDLTEDLQQLPSGQALLVATDSLRYSKELAQIARTCGIQDHEMLLINSQTSSGQVEQRFIRQPDTELAAGKLKLIIATPSMATGVSIECQDRIAKVYGIFLGGSIIDADMAQALARVRQPVPRVVWVAAKGCRTSPAGSSTNYLELKAFLKERQDADVALIRSSLKEDQIDGYAAYSWESDPHLNLYCKIEADLNFSMANLRRALLVRLQSEGHQVTVEQHDRDLLADYLLKKAREAVKAREAQAIATARVLEASEAKELEAREGISPEDRKALDRFHLADFYATPEVSAELVLWDGGGRRRSELLGLEAQLFPEASLERDIVKFERQQNWAQGLTPWDLGDSEVKRQVRRSLGLEDFLNPSKEWTAAELKPYADKARQYARQIKTALSFTIHDRVTDTQIVHQLLSQLGIKITFRWSRSYPGQEGKKLRVYRLDAEHWQQMQEVLQRRQQRRDERSSLGPPPLFIDRQIGGDPALDKELCPLDSPQRYHLKPPNQREAG
jgi:hypothetical protein